MSRLGKIPIKLPAGTEAKITAGQITVKGPRGELSLKLPDLVSAKIADNAVKVDIASVKSKKEKAFWGLYWSIVRNMVKGVSEGFKKELEVIGVGYRASTNGRKLLLNLGFSHPVEYDLPAGINAAVQGNIISLTGIDKQLLGETASQIRRIKKPEPYKGKGIKYTDETIRRKAGKTAAKGE
ncbi:MAG: 50S ribosomal protein L6 [Planctomycetes bacterium]|jgi:large subunit ribosomal protein L6|nr:50S ribosomal protein L6 [Planctomycetota bacterium]